MARDFKLCILRARNNTSSPVITDEACRQFLIEAADRSALVQYWRDVTFGFVNIQVEMMPWVDITVGDDTGRGMVTWLAYQATERAGRNLSGYHGFLTIVQPGFVEVANPRASEPGQSATVRNYFDGGASGFNDGRTLCTLPVSASNHTFMVHELGHVLGYDHTWGLTNNGVDWNPEPPYESSNVYGDPYDIMSSASFGSRWDPSLPQWYASPTFSRSDLATVNPGWPLAEAWGSMGPRLSPAALRHRDPEALGARGRVLVRPATGWTGYFNLQSAGSPDRSGLRLLILRPPGSSTTGPDPDGTLYVEYRGLDGWDRGLDTAGDDLARRAVVIHERASDGAGNSVMWYRGRLLVPAEVDRDIKPATSDLVVQLASAAADFSEVTVGLGTDHTRRVIVTSDSRVVRTTIVAREQEEVHFLCGTGTYELRTLDVELAATFRASAFGYGGTGLPDTSRPPRLDWTIGGVTVGGPNGTVVVPTNAGDRSVTIDFTIDAVAGTLVLRNRPGDDQYGVSVVARISEADGSEPRNSAISTFAVDGRQTRYEDRYYRDMANCEQRLFARLHFKRRWWVPDPDPIRDLIFPPRPPIDRLKKIADVIRKERPDVADDLLTLAKTRAQADKLAVKLHEKVKLNPKLAKKVIEHTIDPKVKVEQVLTPQVNEKVSSKIDQVVTPQVETVSPKIAEDVGAKLEESIAGAAKVLGKQKLPQIKKP